MKASMPDVATLVADVDRLIEEDRISCLWFLRPDYRPATREERVRAWVGTSTAQARTSSPPLSPPTMSGSIAAASLAPCLA